MLQINGDELSISEAIDFLIANKKYLEDSERQRLYTSLNLAPLNAEDSSSNNSEVGSMDLLLEVQEQMTMVRRLRRAVTAKGDEATTKDLKDLVSTSTSLFSMLTKLHDDVLNQDRLRKVENATIKAVDELPLKAQKAFFEALEKALEE